MRIFFALLTVFGTFSAYAGMAAKGQTLVVCEQDTGGLMVAIGRLNSRLAQFSVITHDENLQPISINRPYKVSELSTTMTSACVMVTQE